MTLREVVSAGLRARIVQARTAAQDLGWAVELRRRGEDRRHVGELARSARRDAAVVHDILECEAERVAPFSPARRAA